MGSPNLPIIAVSCFRMGWVFRGMHLDTTIQTARLRCSSTQMILMTIEGESTEGDNKRAVGKSSLYLLEVQCI